jgi:muramoyltetrapeptide carboxypeptidase
MITPPPLKPGDNVVLIAPGRKIDEKSVEIASKTFKSWGLNVARSNNLVSSEHSYFSAHDDARIDDLQNAVNDPHVNAVICVRGGYGTTRIIDALTLDGMHTHPKWIVGFSDVTALHLKLFQEQIKSIHGTMPVVFGATDATLSIESLRRALFGNSIEILFPSPTKITTAKTEATVIGGNLSLIVDSLGTATEIDTDGKILIVEEVDEYLYRMDRMFVQLARAGKLKNLKALIVGHTTDLKDSEQPFGETVEEMALSHTSHYDYPVAFNFPSGHKNPNIAWIHGGKALLIIDKNHSMLKFIE